MPKRNHSYRAAVVQIPGDPKAKRILATTVVILTLIRLVAAAWWPPTGDEAYHWEWSLAPAWGYYDHPPLHAWSMAAVSALFGQGSAQMRLPSILAMAAFAFLVAGLTRSVARSVGATPVDADRAAATAGILTCVNGIHAMLGAYATGDPLLCTVWAATLWAAWRALDGGRWLHWLAVGLGIGIGFQTKFLIGGLGISFAIAVLVEPTWRRWLVRPQAYVAVLVAAAITAPLLYWNATHDWSTFRFNLETRQRQNHFDLRQPPLYLVSQALAVTPLIWAGCLWAAWLGLRRRLHGAAPVLRLLAITGLVPLGMFLWQSFTRQIGLHWTAAAYTGPCVLLALWWHLGGAWPRLRHWAIGIPAVLTGSAILLLVLPPAWFAWPLLIRPFLAPTVAEVADGAEINVAGEIIGWPAMPMLLERIRQEIGPDTAMLAAQYGFVADLRFSLPGHPPVWLWEKPYPHGQQHRFWDDWSALTGRDVLFITRKESRAHPCLDKLREHCREVGPVQTLEVVEGGHVAFRVWYAIGRRFGGRSPDWTAAASTAGATPP